MNLKIIEVIAERKIREAMDRGEFDSLPHKGKPLPPDGLEKVPEEVRMAYKLLKNAGILPEELMLRKNIASLQRLLDGCISKKERDRLTKELNDNNIRYNIIMEKRTGKIIF